MAKNINSPVIGKEPEIQGLEPLKREVKGNINSPVIGKEPEIQGLEPLKKE